MKRFLFVIITLALAGTLHAQVTPSTLPGSITFVTSLSASTSTGNCISLVGSGINLHKFSWSTVGTVSAGAVKLQQSAFADCSMATDLIAAQTVTASGGPTTITSGTPNYIRFVASTPITGAGTVTARYFGYVDRIANINGSGVAGDCAQWVTSTTLGAAATPCGTAGGAIWGMITGDIANQTDLIELIANSISPPSAQGNFLISGGQVNWLSNYTFLVSAAEYYINGALYSSAQQQVSLDPADMMLDRIDAIALDNTGTAVVITGTASATPSAPVVDPGTQLALSIISVPAGSTEPSGATSVLVYDEDTGHTGMPAEWDFTSSSGTLVLNSTNNPYTGTKDIEGTAVANRAYVQGQYFSATLDPNSYDQFVFYIRSKAAWPNNRSIQVSFLLNNVLKGQAVTITASNGSFGFNSSITGSYQQIAIPTGQFGIFGSQINQVRIQAIGTGMGFYLDTMSFRRGSGTPPPTTGLSGTGATDQVAVWNGPSTLGGSDNLKFNPTTGLSVMGTTDGLFVGRGTGIWSGYDIISFLSTASKPGFVGIGVMPDSYDGDNSLYVTNTVGSNIVFGIAGTANNPTQAITFANDIDNANDPGALFSNNATSLGTSDKPWGDFFAGGLDGDGNVALHVNATTGEITNFKTVDFAGGTTYDASFYSNVTINKTSNPGIGGYGGDFEIYVANNGFDADEDFATAGYFGGYVDKGVAKGITVGSGTNDGVSKAVHIRGSYGTTAYGVSIDAVNGVNEAYGLNIAPVSGASGTNFELWSGSPLSAFDATVQTQTAGTYTDGAVVSKINPSNAALQILTQNGYALDSASYATGNIGGRFGGASFTATGYPAMGQTIHWAEGARFSVGNIGAGTIDAAFGVHVTDGYNEGGGTLTEDFGIKIDPQTGGTTNYNLWSGPAWADLSALAVWPYNKAQSTFTVDAAPNANNALGAYAQAIGTYTTPLVSVMALSGDGASGENTDIYSFATVPMGGTIGYMDGLAVFNAKDGAGTLGVATGVHVYSLTNSGGGATTENYGIKVESQTAATNNWAIQTGLGKVELGNGASATLTFDPTVGYLGLNSTAVGVNGQGSIRNFQTFTATGAGDFYGIDSELTINANGFQAAAHGMYLRAQSTEHDAYGANILAYPGSSAVQGYGASIQVSANAASSGDFTGIILGTSGGDGTGFIEGIRINASGESYNKYYGVYFGTNSGTLSTNNANIYMEAATGYSIYTAGSGLVRLGDDIQMADGQGFGTDTTTAHTAVLRAYDVDGAAYKTFATLTNGNTPSLTIGTPAGASLIFSDVTGSGNGCLYATSTGVMSRSSFDCSAAQPYDIVFTLAGLPGASTTYPWIVFDRAVTFPDNWSGAYCKDLTNATATTTITIKKNGSSIGTVVFNTDGTCTFDTTGGATSVSAGDYFTFVTPAQDATLADIMVTFSGTR